MEQLQKVCQVSHKHPVSFFLSQIQTSGGGSFKSSSSRSCLRQLRWSSSLGYAQGERGARDHGITTGRDGWVGNSRWSLWINLKLQETSFQIPCYQVFSMSILLFACSETLMLLFSTIWRRANTRKRNKKEKSAVDPRTTMTQHTNIQHTLYLASRWSIRRCHIVFCKSETYKKSLDGQRDSAHYCFVSVWSRNPGYYFGSLWFMLLSLWTLWTICWCHHCTSATTQTAACVHTCKPLAHKFRVRSRSRCKPLTFLMLLKAGE